MGAYRTLSIDAMGGDFAPSMVVEGIDIACGQFADINFLLYGDERLLTPLLNRFPKVRAVSEIRHTKEVILNEDKPSVVLRGRRNSSMRQAIDAVGRGEADGIVSAGNTGALMAMAKFVLKTLPGISRPAIATYFPTQCGTSVMLDLGANVVCDAENLVQFAVMGEVFARHVLGLENPSVAILNVGVEDLKGHDEVKQASALLQESNLPIRFHGFIEGDGIASGAVDVIVTDGFTGNIVLKASEGMVHMAGKVIKESLMSSLRGRLGALLAKPAFDTFRHTLDPRRYNGAMLLGLNGICIKSHGGTDGLGFANACRSAVQSIDGGFNERIKEDLAVLMAGRNNSTTKHTTKESVDS